MINRVLTLNAKVPEPVGFMAVVYSKDNENKIVIWHKSAVVTEKRDAEFIIEQWKTQLGFGPGMGEVKYTTLDVYATIDPAIVG